jgi:putative transposase
MWDVTWLRGSAREVYYYLYIILDLYGRKIITWDVWEEESAEKASILVQRGILSEQLAKSGHPLVR